MRILVEYKMVNIAKKFSKAIWRKQEVNRVFSFVKSAKERYNLKKCKYTVCDTHGKELRTHYPEVDNEI